MPFFWLRVVMNGNDGKIFKTLTLDSKISALRDLIENDPEYDISDTSYYFKDFNEAELKNKDNTFRDYGMGTRSGPVAQTLHLMYDATGGSFPKEAEPKKKKCIISLEVTDCVDMDCGHYISYNGLRGHLRFTKQKDGLSKIECPLTSCKKIWDWESCLYFANFDNKMKQIYEKLFKERYASQDVSECPKCKSLNKRDRKKVKIYRLVCGKCKLHFCDFCKQKWLRSGLVLCGNEFCDTFEIQKALNNCKWLPQDKNTYTAQYAKDSIPSIRACPRCWSIIHHKTGCLRMPCPKCKHQFCYVCLKPWEGHGYNNKTCFGTTPAPRQQLP